MTSNILVDILNILGCLDAVKRDDKKRPFLLIDGHDSRLKMPILQYINTSAAYLAVCLWVPYGTALWQMGDSKEQHGSFNIALTNAKQDLFTFKLKYGVSGGSLQPTDLIPLINRTLKSSFGHICTNKKAIAEWGWNPLNQNLLLNLEIWATVTKDEKEQESSSSHIVVNSKKIKFNLWHDCCQSLQQWKLLNNKIAIYH